MSFKLDEKDHIVCFWMADDFDDNNFLMLLRRRDGHYVIDYRFRYVKDNRVFDSDDEKNFYQAKFKDLDVTETVAVETCQKMFSVVGTGFSLRNICQRVDGGMDEFVEAMSKYECFHVKTLEK